MIVGSSQSISKIQESPVNEISVISKPEEQEVNIQPSKNNLAKRVGMVMKRVLPELVLSLSLNFAAMAFFATPMSIPLLSLMLIGSFALGCIFGLKDSSRSKNKLSGEMEDPMRGTRILSRTSIVNTIGWSGPNLWIHESGHAISATALFKEAQVKMWVKPFQGGATTYTASHRLTQIGQWFGKSRAMLVTAAAGLAASTIFVMSELGIANKCKKSNPTISQYLKLHAFTTIFNEAVYGLTAFLASRADLGHDLVRLWRVGGIHPLIPIIAVVALPLIQVTLYQMTL